MEGDDFKNHIFLEMTLVTHESVNVDMASIICGILPFSRECFSNNVISLAFLLVSQKSHISSSVVKCGYEQSTPPDFSSVLLV